jgi:hypothetical protein
MGTLASELRPLAADVAAGPRVYVDANVPAALVERMRRELRWDVLFVIEDEALRRDADRRHYDRALDLGRTIITLDRDFLDERRFPTRSSPGVVVCAAPDEARLLGLLRHVDRLLRAGNPQAPLLGRKVAVTPSDLSDDANPARRRRRRAARPGRRRPDDRRRG